MTLPACSDPSNWDTVDVYPSTGDPIPYATISRDEARILKKAGTHYFINHGKAMREVSLRPAPVIDMRLSTCGLEDWQRVHYSALSGEDAKAFGVPYIRLTTQQIVVRDERPRQNSYLRIPE